MSVHTITISDLLSLSRPLTGAASLYPSYSPPLKKHRPQPTQVISESVTDLLLTYNNTNPEPFFTPLIRPVLLIGTVDLPSDPYNHFLSISDGSSTIFCEVLDFNLNIIGCRINVLAWNFLPLKRLEGGLLEVIRWSMFQPIMMPKDTSVLSLQKGTEFKKRKTIMGVLRSVSPVFVVPCRNQRSGTDSVGFLTDIYTCKCRLCNKSFTSDHFACSIWKQHNHCFTVSEFVYFIKPSSVWRLALAKLIGKVIIVSGLKKKMIFVGDKTSYAMYITTSEASVSLGPFPMESMRHGVDVWTKIIQEVAVYIGVVTGVYMQGMAIELDDKVWLLITDPNLAPLAALRIGAIISVRNFESIQLVVSGIETSMLASCCRTAIDIKAFALSNTRYPFRSQSQSLLGKFIESLIPTARFWMLLLISCFRRKFTNIMSNKEILGSGNKEGIVHIYARASLLPHFFEPQHGVFMEFCQQWTSAAQNENNKTLKLVVPVSNFISKCEIMWTSLLKEIQCHDGNLSGSITCKGVPSIPIIRRIISSDVLGCILAGSIKCTSSGKLQLFDATGSVDIVVPDILSSFHCQGIHEVKEFTVILEGPPMQVESSKMRCVEPFSCRNIFGELPAKENNNQLVVYVHFYLKESTCLNAPISLPLCMTNNSNTNASGIAHLLLVTHKFPAAGTYKVDANTSSSNSLFAEALLLPYDAILLGKDAREHGETAYVSERNIVEMKYRSEPKIVESSRISDSASNNDINSFGLRHGFPFLLTWNGSLQIHVAGYLRQKECSGLDKKSVSFHPILLEFLSGTFIKYQSLLVGGYYIMKCSKECSFCFPKDEKKCICDKVVLSSNISMWKVSFSFDMPLPKNEQQRFRTSRDSSIRSYQTCSRNICQNDLVFQQSCMQMSNMSDVHLLISRDTLGSLDQIEALETEIFSHFHMLQEVLTVSSIIQIMKSDISRPLKCVGLQYGSKLNSKLISVCGNIESMHLFNCGSFISKDNVALSHKGVNICLHVYDDRNMIHIRGKLNRYAYPVGLGHGVNATFHRVYLKCSSSGLPILVLTTVSLIVINSVKEISFHCRKRPTMLPQSDTICEESRNFVSLSLISQYIELLDVKLTRMLCRAVTIHFLVMENSEHVDFKGSGSRMPSINIPFAGFLIDDGSSLFCCWADAKRAEMLLRLDEISCLPFFQCGVPSVKKSVDYHDTVGFHLDMILRKHHKIIMKNYRAVPDASSVDFMFDVNSHEVFNSAEESLLRFVINYACQAPAFNVTGHLIDPTSLGSLPSEYGELWDIVQPLPKIWAAEIEQINSLKQARDLLDELSSR